MKSYIMYECEKCGKTSKDLWEIKRCEASHYDLSKEEEKEWKILKAIVQKAGLTIHYTKNAQTEKEFDEAIKALIKFEKEHNIKHNLIR